MPQDKQELSAGRLLVFLRPVGRHGKFSAEFAGELIVKASTRPMIEAAKVLRNKGYGESFLLVARYIGADHDAMWGNLGAILRSAAAKSEDEDDDSGAA